MVGLIPNPIGVANWNLEFENWNLINHRGAKLLGELIIDN